MDPIYLKDIVRYRYFTGTKYMKQAYGIEQHEHGPFYTDIEDFKKFFDQIKDGGEVTELYLITKKGCYSWKPKQGWTYFGK